MQFNRNTSIGNSRSYLVVAIKIILILVTLSVAIILLNKIDFPTPNKKIEKIIPNENLKIKKKKKIINYINFFIIWIKCKCRGSS